MSEATLLLTAVEQGDPKAAEKLLALLYGELRHLAASKMAREREGQTLQPTALVHEAWLLRLPNGRISPTEYEKLCTAIDKAAFKPLDYLNGKFRKQLADWNQKNPTKAIHTFCRLFNSKLTLARRGMLRRLNRAKFVWIKHSKLSAI